jgi:hypothetical protein
MKTNRIRILIINFTAFWDCGTGSSGGEKGHCEYESDDLASDS